MLMRQIDHQDNSREGRLDFMINCLIKLSSNHRLFGRCGGLNTVEPMSAAET